MSNATEPNKSTESGFVWQQIDSLLADAQMCPTPPTPQELMSNIDNVVQQAEQKQTRQRRRRGLFVSLIALVAVIGFLAVICNVIGEEFNRGMNEMIAGYPVTYTMPVAAQIIDQYTSKADPFGDFAYCASFRVSDSELNNLLSKGWDWIQADSLRATSGFPGWQTGRIARAITGGECDNLKPWLDEANIYRYLLAKGDRNDWIRLLAIDEKERIIFYYRSSW